jgi:quercetin dioxygenase-like cupin family protein
MLRTQGETMKLPHAKGLPLFAALLLMSLCNVPILAADPIRAMTVDSIEFKPDAAVPGVATALIAGNPKQGPTYTIRAKFSPNTRVPAHFHPDQRVVTVISGTYYLGSGEKFDESAMKAYGPGTVILVPAGAPHFSASREDGAVVQESGDGATGITLLEKK